MHIYIHFIININFNDHWNINENMKIYMYISYIITFDNLIFLISKIIYYLIILKFIVNLQDNKSQNTLQLTKDSLALIELK